MEKVAGRWEKAPVRCNAVLLAMSVVCPVAWAQDAGQTPAEAVVAEARTGAPVRVQVQTSALPRLDSQDSGFQAPRVDVSLFPANAGGVGAVVGMSGFSSRQPLPLGLAPVQPSLDFGVRFSHKLQSQNQIDITAWRRMNTADDAYTLIQARQPVYGARVEMNLKASKTGIVALDRGFVGLQLESGARISIKRKNGGPMLYYRTTF
jgi:hypothetical protein